MVEDLENRVNDLVTNDVVAAIGVMRLPALRLVARMYMHEFQDIDKTIHTVLTTWHNLSIGANARDFRNIVLMRPVNSMVESKQINGCGTGLYEGKDYSRIYDFVKVYEDGTDPYRTVLAPCRPATSFEPG